ncbi:outer membrane lipoprotein carrier protein LolA [Chitiniphilus purpureus]|uniref:Outer membrane lipoprotein carrier protein LolA n=1 Tax=Chitiniphilus purpureus TaxID=2981137 RepID=A0ABY6DNP5_9NEIS|nr:outer membrane lipoprotein carrier protein LolA [Chitiniphilus sp. CD1]UXY16002.1 outer membrane lipoprotein carrier protein LolA [Chitiniphilus sp. CD1]
MRLIAACALMLACAVAAAQVPLSEVQARLDQARVIRGEFTQLRELVGVDKPLRASGRFVLDRARGVVWETRKPFAQTLRITRDEIVQRQGETVTLRLNTGRDPAAGTVGTVLFALMAGDFEGLARYFEIEASVDGARWQVNLTPRTATLGKLMRTLSLSGAKTVETIDLTAQSGDATRIALRGVTLLPAPGAAEDAAFE